MDKVFTIKYDSLIIDSLSDKISEFVSTIENDCDGVFTVCYDRGKGKLRSVSVCVVSNDLELIKTINGQQIESDICPISVIGIPSMCFLGVKADLPVDRMLKSGKIIYDPEGTLRGIKKNVDSSKNVVSLAKRGAIKTKPPIQYTKKI